MVALAVVVLGVAVGAALLAAMAPIPLTWVALGACVAATSLALIEVVWPSHRCRPCAAPSSGPHLEVHTSADPELAPGPGPFAGTIEVGRHRGDRA